MDNNEKIQAFLDLMALNRKNVTELVKQYLVQYNPPVELILELKSILENQNIDMENECFDFMDKFKEYKRCLKSSIEIQMKESMNENFMALMGKNFPGVK